MSTQRPPFGQAAATASSSSIPSSFHVGSHVVRVTKVMEGRWTVTVDESPGTSSYATQADAWEAGVREADRLDRDPPVTTR